MENVNSRYKKVMVIDDTYVDRFIADRNIKKYGFAEEVILMESAKMALEYLVLPNCSCSKTKHRSPPAIFRPNKGNSNVGSQNDTANIRKPTMPMSTILFTCSTISDLLFIA